MNRLFSGFQILPLALLLAVGGSACSNNPASADSLPESDQTDQGVWSTVKEAVLGKRLTVPAGTPLEVRLENALHSGTNRSGDSFDARLAKDVIVEGRVVAPAGAHVVGRLVDVDRSGRVKGRARMVMTLDELELDEEKYSLSTDPLVAEAEGTVKRDAAVIGGSSAIGAVVGAIAGGKKGAATGAGVGAGASTGFVLLTKGKEVKFSPETRLIFRLSEPLELPAKE